MMMDTGTSDDTTLETASFPSKVASMSSHLISRGEAEDWAWKDMKFLVYDDYAAKLDGYDSDDEDATLAFALRMSTESDEHSTTKLNVPGSSTETALESEPGPAAGNRANEAVHGHHPSKCTTCALCPEFPKKWKTRKLRLFKPFDTLPAHEICSHYVAISYCWPTPEVDADGNPVEPERSYTIRELDGTVRKSRALDDVLDRAIDVAVDFGLRMIWIDQECLPQPKEESSEEQKKEQQLGVQAMDIVYNRARLTAGLHEGIITNQAQMQALELLKQADLSQSIPSIDVSFLNHVLDFFETVTLDRWYTRAWVVQEALSASSLLMLVFRRGLGISCSYHYTHTRGQDEMSSCNSREIPSDNIYISANDLRAMVRLAKRLLERDFTSFDQALMRVDDRPRTLLRRAGPILRAAEDLHPLLVDQDPRKPVIWIQRPHSYAFRYTVDAAAALTLLKTRGCRDQQDRIAIMANMCNYGTRLDTRSAANNDMLCAGLMALALLNGDLSILVPEAYIGHTPRAFEQSCSTLWPPDNFPDLINHMVIRNINQHRVNALVHLTDQGIGMQTCLWAVEDELDLSPIKYQWEEDWKTIKCLEVMVEPRKGETDAEFAERQRQIGIHFSKQAVMRQAVDELGSKRTPLPADSPVWGPIRSEGIRVTQRISAHRVKQMPIMQDIICRVFFGVLRYLTNLAETDPRASSLATSIWQSVRVDMVGTRDDLPDEVDEGFFEHPDIVATPFKTLQLDLTPDGTYSQLWFIDRIMEFGTLWVGRYVSDDHALPLSRINRHDSSESLQAQESENDNDSSMSLSSKGKQVASTTGAEKRRLESKIILQKQRVLQFMGSMLQSTMATGNDPELGGAGRLVGFAHLVAMAQMANREGDRAEEQVRKRISTFDVDGTCLVATPWNPEWERLPHADFRSMSVCWVVEPVIQPGVHGDGNGKSADDSDQDFSVGPNDEGKASRAGEEMPTYRVLGKVKGLWQLMDMPIQRVLFT
ncbi:hypothetical protein GGR52DRAFT_564578 [Hypoxylon sp. FL1284]|nr:hypothetical protein GGR52DRAFT_564578 [Hypoxylon sp. FL1284]